MPNKIVERLIEDVDELKKNFAGIIVELRWLKWIITGAASLGFLEKILGWIK